MTVEKFPLDFDAIEKPSWIEGEQLYRAVGFTPADNSRWQFGLLKLSRLIERQTGFVCRIDHDRIRVCDDAEACEYTNGLHERAQQMMGSAFSRRALIDRSKLTEEQRDLAEKRDRYLGSVTQAARAEARKQRKIQGLIHRPTPLVGASEED